MQFEPQFPKDSVAYDKTKIDSILKVRLVDFPKLIQPSNVESPWKHNLYFR
jgi:hypothetical protein